MANRLCGSNEATKEALTQMRTIAIIQARMGSTRLPGKSMMKLNGEPLVAHVIERVMQSKVDDVAVTVPLTGEDGQLITAVRELGVEVVSIPCNPNDLLLRYAHAASWMHADTVVRVPADNPCVDPDEIDRIVDSYTPGQWLTSNLDQNILNNGYPGGLGAEVYDVDFLYWLYETVTDARQKEHPHLWAFDNHCVHTIPAPAAIARPQLHFDVNTQHDFDYIDDIYRHMPENFRTKDMLAYLDGKSA